MQLLKNEIVRPVKFDDNFTRRMIFEEPFATPPFPWRYGLQVGKKKNAP